MVYMTACLISESESTRTISTTRRVFWKSLPTSARAYPNSRRRQPPTPSTLVDDDGDGDGDGGGDDADDDDDDDDYDDLLFMIRPHH